jgi:hypothetical protein
MRSVLLFFAILNSLFWLGAAPTLASPASAITLPSDLRDAAGPLIWTNPQREQIVQDLNDLNTILFQYGDRGYFREGMNGPDRPSDLLYRIGLTPNRNLAVNRSIEDPQLERRLRASLPPELREDVPARTLVLRLLRRSALFAVSTTEPGPYPWSDPIAVVSPTSLLIVNALVDGAEVLLKRYQEQRAGLFETLTEAEREKIHALVVSLKHLNASDWPDSVIETLVVTPHGGLIPRTATESYREAKVGVGAILQDGLNIGPRTAITNTRIVGYDSHMISIGSDCVLDGVSFPRRNLRVNIGDHSQLIRAWFYLLTVQDSIEIGPYSQIRNVHLAGPIDRFELKGQNELRNSALVFGNALMNEEVREKTSIRWIQERNSVVRNLYGAIDASRGFTFFRSESDSNSHRLIFEENTTVEVAANANQDQRIKLCQQNTSERAAFVHLKSRRRLNHATRVRNVSELRERCEREANH